MVSTRWTVAVLSGAASMITLGAIAGRPDTGPGPPGNDDCAEATVISEGSVDGDTIPATNDGSVSCGNSSTTPDVWFAYTAPATEILEVTTCGGAAWDTFLSIHTGCPGTADNEIACNDDNCDVQSRVTALVTQGITYFIRVSGWDGATGPFTATVTLGGPPPIHGAQVHLGPIGAMQQWAREGDVIAVGMDSAICNNGSEPLDWFGNPDPRHPMMAFNLYRLRDDRFEQIGLSWLKHGFASAQADACGLGCVPYPDNTRTGVGCSDTYGVGTNVQQSHLGPRYEVDPFTAEFAFEGSHLDIDPGIHGLLDHRLQVHDDDLDPALNPDAQYFAELQIIHHQDTNPWDSIGWEEVLVSGVPGDEWLFDVSVTATAHGPAMSGAWTGAEVTTVADESGRDGLAFLAAKSAANGDGTWHYEYAVFNHSLDRGIGAFTVPVGAATMVTNVGFRAVPSHEDPYSNDPWLSSHAAGTVRWATDAFETNPLANPIRWGTLYNFWFDADAEPGPATATLELFAPGAPASLSGATTGPQFDPVPGDIDADADVDFGDILLLLGAWGPCPPIGACPADLNGDGAVGFADLLILLSNWSG